MLEAFPKDSKKTNKTFYIINMKNKNTIRLGRGHDSDIRISDISVSRFHAMIKFHNGSFYLKDNDSKFGTLIQYKRPIEVDSNTHANL